MKRSVFVLSGGLLLSCVLTYILIPTVIVIRKSVSVNNNQKAMQRSLSDSSKWKFWWPGVISADRLVFRNKDYLVTDHTFSSVLIDIINKNTIVKSSLTFISLTKDSANLEWSAEMYSSYNPYKRLTTYLYARSIGNDLLKILDIAKRYFSNSESIYGLDIRRETVKNSSLIFTIDSSLGYPSTEKIYGMIALLRKYIVNNNAVAVDSPMLNVHSNDSVFYITRVAIPTDRKLPPSGKIQYKWMLEGGNILSAEIKGDRKKVDSALEMVEKYVQDYKLIAPAIPFYSLMTNRLAEKDSSKWVTKIFYPIMYFE